mmetsp:Transcript_87522/g.255910  ORF Transcript_87522/g.255910 Transcript_87522/m.255910 type:complete len:231 (+) Transcript_87522:298-990(+)
MISWLCLMTSMTSCWCKLSNSMAFMLFWTDLMESKAATRSPLSATPLSFSNPETSSLTSRVPLPFASSTSKSVCRLLTPMSRSSSISCTSGFCTILVKAACVTCSERFDTRALLSSSKLPKSGPPVPVEKRFHSDHIFALAFGRQASGSSSSASSASPAPPVQKRTMMSCNFLATRSASVSRASRLRPSSCFAFSMVFSTNTAMMRLNSPKMTKSVTIEYTMTTRNPTVL